jgi:sec-independent protein translocase protein TatB
MFDIGSTELLLIAIVAIVVIGPRDLPRALYKLGQIMGKARGMARHFRTGIDAMVREAEMEELEKKWAAENERIMKEFPTVTGVDDVPVALAAPAKGPASDQPVNDGLGSAGPVSNEEAGTVAPDTSAEPEAAAAKNGPAA